MQKPKNWTLWGGGSSSQHGAGRYVLYRNIQQSADGRSSGLLLHAMLFICHSTNVNYEALQVVSFFTLPRRTNRGPGIVCRKCSAASGFYICC